MPAEIPKRRASWPEASIQVGRWRVDPRSLTLADGAEDRRLEPRVMRLLLALAEAPARVVTRQELLDRIWPDAFVNEDALTRAVSDLRRELGDGAGGEPAIATVRGVGYRLDLPVSETASPGPLRTLPRKTLFAAATVAVLAVVAVLVLRPARSPGPILHLRSLTSRPGFETDPALSADGRLLAYTWSEDFWSENYNLYLRAMDGGSAQALTLLPGTVSNPAFSPDAAAIAFAYTEGRRHSIRRVASSGGAPRVLATTGSWVFGLDWSPDGQRIVFAERGDGEHRFHLATMRSDGSDLRRLSTPPANGMGDHSPAFSPEGRRIAFLRSDLLGYRTLWVLPASGGAPTALTLQSQPISSFDWEDEDHVVYAVDLPGDARLYRLDAETRESAPVPADNRRIHRVAAAAGRLVIAEPSGDEGIFRLEADGEARELAPSTQWDGAVAVAAETADIAFLSARDGSIAPWMLPAGHREAVRVAASRPAGQPAGRPAWQGDGWRLAMVFRDDEGYRIDIHDRDSGQTREFFRDPRALQLAAWSRDGRWLYFSREVDDQWSVWRIGTVVPGAPPQRVAGPGAFSAQETMDGKALVYLNILEGGLWQRQLPEDLVGEGDARVTEKLLDLPAWQSDFWGLTRAGVYRLAGGPDGFGLRLGPAGAPPETGRLLVMPERQLIKSASINADGSVVVFGMETPTGADLRIAELDSR